jgi:signal transduction histidine kinase
LSGKVAGKSSLIRGLPKHFVSWLARSLANQLLVTYLLVLTIALVTVTVFALFLIKTESIADLRNSLEVEAVNLGLEIDNDLALDSAGAKRRIQLAAQRHASKLGLSVTVVDDDGHVIVDSGGSSQSVGENISNQPEINDALAGIAAIYTRNPPKSNSEWLFVAYPLRAAGETRGVIRIGMPLTEQSQRLHKDLIIFLEIIVATAVITVVISIVLARRVTRPVRKMSEMAKEIARSGDISEFVPAERSDEIGELGQSFNQMIGRLREQERLRQEFIANASHELQTPTMAIGSVVEALQAGAAEDKELRTQFLSSLERLVDRQTGLLRDLLDVSLLDAKSQSPWTEDFAVQDVLLDACDQVKGQARKKEITLEIASELSGVLIEGDGLQLQRALLNLLANAVNYTPSGGKVTVTAGLSAKKEIEISIQDNGVGIEASDLPHIFDRFYRGDKARSRASGGSGLGLAITRDIVMRHHGRVEVDSVVGQGSTFKVSLPVKGISGQE